MKSRQPIAILCLFACLVPRVYAESGPVSSPEVRTSIESRKSVKRGIQVMVRPDGRLVDRLAELPSSEAPPDSGTLNPHDLPASPEAWLARMIDPTRNGLAAKNPEFFLEWLDAVTEPRFMTALASIAIKPETYSNGIGRATSPAVARNWAEFADPGIYLRWMAAGLDPRFYQAIFNRMSDSGKLRRWGFPPGSGDNSARTQNLPNLSGPQQISSRESRDWLQLPSRESKANPWLLNNANYRY